MLYHYFLFVENNMEKNCEDYFFFEIFIGHLKSEIILIK